MSAVQKDHQALVRPGHVTATSRDRRRVRFGAPEPFARTVDDDSARRAESTILRDELGWSDADIAELLGNHYSNMSRRRINGFNPEQVAVLRALLEAHVP